MKKLFFVLSIFLLLTSNCLADMLSETRWWIQNSGGYSFFFYGGNVHLMDYYENLELLQGMKYSGMFFYGNSCDNLRNTCYSIYGKCFFSGVGFSITCVDGECSANILKQLR